MVRFVVVKLTHLDLNFRFDIDIVFIVNYSFSERHIDIVFMVNYSFSERRIDSEAFLMTNFVNLNIKPTQFFRDTHRSRMCIRMFI
jgi:hypothetical protein